MIDPYQPPSASLGNPLYRRGITIIAVSFLSSLILMPAIILVVGWLRDRDFPRFLFDPRFLLIVAAFSLVSALIVYPSRKWHRLVPVLLSPVVGFGLLAAFLVLGHGLTT
jgi:hypothetical protein